MACPDDDTFARFVEGLLPSGEAAAIERHVDGCARCADLAAAFGRLYLTRVAGSPNGDAAPQLGTALFLSALLHVAWVTVVTHVPRTLATLAPASIGAVYRAYATIWGPVGAAIGLLAALALRRGWRRARSLAVVHAALALPSIVLTPLAAFVVISTGRHGVGQRSS
jgi:hypothetical protein